MRSKKSLVDWVTRLEDGLGLRRAEREAAEYTGYREQGAHGPLAQRRTA